MQNKHSYPTPKPATAIEPAYLTTDDISVLLSVSTATLKKWRLGGHKGEPPVLTEGAHWIAYSSRKVLFNKMLMLDFIATRHCPSAHDALVTEFLKGLPSSRLFQ
jgi:hypothetical protein